MFHFIAIQIVYRDYKYTILISKNCIVQRNYYLCEDFNTNTKHLNKDTKMLEVGLTHQSVMRVMEGNTAEFIGSGDMAVLATPAMVALMENAAMLAVALKLEEGETTVGSMISTSHLKPSKVGNTVSAIAELTAIEGRKLTFKISAYDGETLIGEGEHIRFIVNREKFLSKL